MMDRGLRVTEKIHGVMVAATTQKCEKVTAPVRDAKTEDIAIESHHAGDVGAGIGEVAELERHHAGEGVIVRGERAFGKYFERGAFGILECQRFANAGRDVVAALALESGL